MSPGLEAACACNSSGGAVKGMAAAVIEGKTKLGFVNFWAVLS
jgi:hypothetical protein